MAGHHGVLIFECTPTMTPDAEERWLRKFYGVKDSDTIIRVTWPGTPEIGVDTVLEFDALTDTELE